MTCHSELWDGRPVSPFLIRVYRRGGDSNPRYGVTRTLVFETSTFSRSDTSPALLTTIPHARFVPLADLLCSVHRRAESSRNTGRFASAGSAWRAGGRVVLGGCPPRAPTDPYVHDSRIRFLKSRVRYATVHRVDHDRPWERITLQQPRESWPRVATPSMSAGQPLAPGPRHLAVEHGQRETVARDSVIREVPFQLPARASGVVP